MTVDDFFHDICVEAPPPATGGRAEPSAKAVDEEVWREITAAAGRRGDGGGSSAEITLEDFLARAGMEEAAVAAARVSSAQGGGFVVDPVVGQQIVAMEHSGVGFGSGGVEGSGGEVGRGRGSKRMMMDPLDKAALQRQKRMIKNRESAARSREKKQAYTAELESVVARLEEENAQLLRAQEEQQQMRLKQLLETLIPVTEMKKPRRILRRTHSMEW